jgi:hypothetical protein
MTKKNPSTPKKPEAKPLTDEQKRAALARAAHEEQARRALAEQYAKDLQKADPILAAELNARAAKRREREEERSRKALAEYETQRATAERLKSARSLTHELGPERREFEHYYAIEQAVSRYLKRLGWGPRERQAHRIVDAVLRGFSKPGALPADWTSMLDRLESALDRPHTKDAMYLRATQVIDRWGSEFITASNEEDRAKIANWAVGDLIAWVDRDWGAKDTDTLQDQLRELLLRYAPKHKPGKLTAAGVLSNLNASVGAMGFSRTGDPNDKDPKRKQAARNQIRKNTKSIGEGTERERARLE